MGSTRRAEPKPRRRPRNCTAEELVDAILDAAAIILERDGVAAMTTNRLAERAGVSIGSLYHYFPNKEAVVAALASRLDRRAAALLERRYGAVADQPRTEMVRALATALTSTDLGSPAARRALLMDVPRRWVAESNDAHDAFVRGLLERILRQRQANLRSASPELMAIVMEHAVRGVVEGVLMHHPELLDSPALAEEITCLVARYLERPPEL